MRKVLLGIAAAATVLIGSIEMADAQQRRNGQGYAPRGGYAQQYRGGNVYRNNGNRYVQNNYYGGRRGGGWNGNGAAWAAGGLAVGAVLGALAAQPNYGYAQPYWGGGAYAPPVPGCAPVMVGRFWNGFNWVPQYAPGC